jgi:hypothetical protein
LANAYRKALGLSRLAEQTVTQHGGEPRRKESIMLPRFLSMIVKACCQLANFFTEDDQRDRTPDLAVLAG